MPPENNKKTRIEKLQDRLYSRNKVEPRDRSVLKDKEYSLVQDWKEEEEPVEKMNIAPKKRITAFSIILILAALFFIGSITYAGLFFFRSENVVSADNVDISIVGPVSISGGEQLSLDVIISNNNQVKMELVDLFVEYPDGTKNPENLSEDLKRTQQDLGDIDAGTVIRRTVNSVLFGPESSVQNIDFRIQYRVPGSNAVFEKQKNFEIALDATPIRLSVQGLRQISSGQTLELIAEIESNSPDTLQNILVTTDYPFGFIYQTSDPKPNFNNNIWLFENLEPKEKKEIKIIGQAEGQNEDQRIFKFNVGFADQEVQDQIAVLVNSEIHETEIQKSFVDIDLEFNEDPNPVVAVESGKTVGGKLTFTNNTNDIIKDLKIELTFDGNVLDESTVNVQGGFYRSIDNKIVWSSEDDNRFQNIDPRDSQSVQFTFDTFYLGGNDINLQNPEIKIDVSASGIRVSDNDLEENIDAETVKTIQVISDVAVNNFTLYETGPFTNSGPIPPIAEQATTYTINWDLTNSTNELSNTVITGTLPSYVAWKGQTDPSSENISFNSNTRQVTWNLGKVRAGDGFITDSREINFQVELFPSISQVGNRVDLVRDIQLNATDSFTGTNIFKNINSSNTIVDTRRGQVNHANVSQ